MASSHIFVFHEEHMALPRDERLTYHQKGMASANAHIPEFEPHSYAALQSQARYRRVAVERGRSRRSHATLWTCVQLGFAVDDINDELELNNTRGVPRNAENSLRMFCKEICD